MSQRLRGLVAQSMNPRKAGGLPRLVGTIDSTVQGATGSFTATTACYALIYGIGAGASGASKTVSAAVSGGGSGAAGYKRFSLSPGQTISWSRGAGGVAPTGDNNGNDGGDTTITLPNGTVLTAGGGKKGLNGASPRTGGAGGQCTGPWDIARTGGKGGDGVTGASTAGESPTGGGTGGGGSAEYGGGAGSAGFTDQVANFPVGAGNVGNGGTPPTAPGAGSGAGAQIAADGRVLIYLVRARAS